MSQIHPLLVFTSWQCAVWQFDTVINLPSSFAWAVIRVCFRMCVLFKPSFTTYHDLRTACTDSVLLFDMQNTIYDTVICDQGEGTSEGQTKMLCCQQAEHVSSITCCGQIVVDNLSCSVTHKTSITGTTTTRSADYAIATMFLTVTASSSNLCKGLETSCVPVNLL